MSKLDFDDAPRVWVDKAEAERLKTRANWFSLDCYGPELRNLPSEVGMVVVRGKITQRIFAYS